MFCETVILARDGLAIHSAMKDGNGVIGQPYVVIVGAPLVGALKKNVGAMNNAGALKNTCGLVGAMKNNTGAGQQGCGYMATGGWAMSAGQRGGWLGQ
jgi:hypothetical protein